MHGLGPPSSTCAVAGNPGGSQHESSQLQARQLCAAEQHDQSTTEFSWLFERTQKRVSRQEGAWAVIAEALPNRTYKAVWAAGTRLFHPGNYQVGCLWVGTVGNPNCHLQLPSPGMAPRQV